ncbi:metal-sulfur cluster assembly factor [Streptococcus dentiloxodontae]
MATFRDDIKINDGVLPFTKEIADKMQTVFDPEIELDIYNLGLIYEINIDETGHCDFLMTFTDTNCGCEDTLPIEVADKLKSIDGINSVKVETTYNPVWKMTRISRYGRIALGIAPRR